MSRGVCKYDGKCHNVAPKHWVDFVHNRQSEAVQGTTSMGDWLKEPSKKEVLVPETPSPPKRDEAAKMRDSLRSREDTPANAPSTKRRKDPLALDDEDGDGVLGGGAGAKPPANDARSRKAVLKSDSEEEEEEEEEELSKKPRRKRARVLQSSDEEEEEGGSGGAATEPSPAKSLVDLTTDTPVKSKKASHPEKKKVVDVDSDDGEEEAEDEEEDDEDDDDEMGEEMDGQVEGVVKDCEKIGDQLEQGVKQLFKMKIEQPPNLGSTVLRLKPYQLVGMSWMRLMHQKDVNGILADEMGLGKTIQSIAFIAWLMHNSCTEECPKGCPKHDDPKKCGPSCPPSCTQHEVRNICGPHVIVTSASTLSNWAREFELWLPSARVVHYHGSMKERTQIRNRLRDWGEFDVIITTYSYFQLDSAKDDRKFLKQIPFQILILDEGHSIKNANSARHKRLQEIPCERRFMLTGTPINNNLPELLSLLSFLVPELFDNPAESLQRAFNEKDEGHALFAKRVKRMLSTFVLRRCKCDVLGELVPKKDCVHKIELTPTQRKVYDGVFSKWRADNDAAKNKGSGKEAKKDTRSMTNVFFDLRKASNHPLLVRSRVSDQALEELAAELHKIGHFGPNCSRDQVVTEMSKYSDWDLHNCCLDHKKRLARYVLDTETILDSAKFKKIKELLPKLKEEGHRVLLFSQWTTMLDIIEELLLHMGMSFIRLDGSTAVAERQQLIDNYNQDSSITVFLLSTRAGGLGINLTAADTVILHDLDYNPQADRQAEDRCHRIGQTKPVTIIRLVCEGTVDEKIYVLAESKKKLADGMLGEAGDSDVVLEGSDDPGKDGSMQQMISEVLNGMLTATA